MTINIEMISVEGCSDCKVAIKKLTEIGKKNKVDIKINKYDVSSEEAINLSIKYDLEEVPSLVIEGFPLNGPTFEDCILEDIFSKLKG